MTHTASFSGVLDWEWSVLGPGWGAFSLLCCCFWYHIREGGRSGGREGGGVPNIPAHPVLTQPPPSSPGQPE